MSRAAAAKTFNGHAVWTGGERTMKVLYDIPFWGAAWFVVAKETAKFTKRES
jgi:hypothetical protein